ncbi:MAG: hypothetical protein GHCLOJNM_03856 [bacterium]|nr:hypothetical protein [bacterium]
MKGASLQTPPNSILLGAAGLSILLAVGLVYLGPHPLALAGVAGLAGGVWLACRPRWLWLLLIAALPFSVEIHDLLGAGNNLVIPTELLTPLAALAVVIAVLRIGAIRFTVSPLHLAAGIYIAVLCVSLARSEIPFVTLKALARTGSAFLGGYILTQMAIREPSDLKVPFRVIVASTLALALYGFYTQFIEGIAIYQDIAHPFFGNHCIYAAFLCFPAAFALGALTQPIPGRSQLAAYLGLLGVAILFTFVRGAWIGLAVLVLFLLSRQRAGLSARFALAFLAVALLGILAVAMLELAPLLKERWQTLFDIRYVANESRIDRWMAAISMWLSAPILGAGYGCYPDLYFSHIYYTFSYEGKLHMGAHNLYLEILAELGVVGLVAFGFLVAMFFLETHRLFRLAGEDPWLRALALGLESMMVVFLVHAFVNNLGPSDEIDIAFWSSLGLAVALRAGVQRASANSLP